MAPAALADFPKFQQVVETALPGTIPLRQYFERSRRALVPHGFEDANTLGLVAACRDEIATPLVEEVIRQWGLTFGCRGLGGFLLLGRSGLATGINHAPSAAGRRRFVLYAMPHIAISADGEIGTVYREGLSEPSHACGSLAAVVKELRSGRIDVRTDFDDLEQCCVRQKLLSALRYGDQPDLLEMTRLAGRVIREDALRLLAGIADPEEFDYACLTGILVHGPADSHWVQPGGCRVARAGLAGGTVDIESF